MEVGRRLRTGAGVCGRCGRTAYVSLGIRYCKGCQKGTSRCTCQPAGV